MRPFVDGDRGGILEGGRSPEALIGAFSFDSMAVKLEQDPQIQERDSALH